MRLLVALVIALVGVGVWGGVMAQGTAGIPCRIEDRPAGEATIEGLQFSGDGDTVTEPFVLPEGATVLSASMESPNDYGHNSIELYPTQDSTAEMFGFLVVSENGPYSGSRVIDLQSGGEVMLAITAAGPWTVTVEA